MCKRLFCFISAVLLLGLASTSQAQIDDPSLAAWWRLDEGSGTLASDSSGGGHDGTLEAGAAWTLGVSKTGVYLDGIDDFIEVPIALTEDGTIGFWFKPDWDGTDPDDYRIFDASLGAIYFFISKGANEDNISKGEIGFYFEDATDADFQTIEFDPADLVFADTWFHLAATWEFGGGSAVLYFNGEEVSRADNLGAFPDLDPNPHFGFETVAYISQTHGAMGVIDEILIYDRALTAEEIPSLMITTPAELAFNPNPADDATDVPRDTTLSWEAGEFAASHDVYFGTAFDDVNNATRSNPLGVLVSQDQAGTTYDPPSRLDFSQTYYWRVDEVNGAPDFTIFKGNVWSFTVEPLAYVIEGVRVTSNTIPATEQGPESIIDGSGLDVNDQHSVDSGDMWSGSPPAGEMPWLAFEFPRNYKLHEMRVWNYNHSFEIFLGVSAKDVTLEYSVDGMNWMFLADEVLPQGPGVSSYTGIAIELGGVAAKYVRMSINSGYGTTSIVGLSEVRFTHIPVFAREPKPADGATDIALDAILSWRPGREAASHEIYIGTDPNTLALAATTTAAAYSPPSGFDLDTTQYWQVIEVNEVEASASWAGDVWSFSLREYIEIDGFETYNDDIDAGTTIWQTWIDGLDDPTNGGGVVGYGQSPFAELTTIRSGKQAMPLFFSNTSASANSEADRTFTSVLNWSASGIKSLSLWFNGALGNTGRLYVKINSTKVLYDVDTEDIAAAQWLPWNIDLSMVGVNLNSINSLTIGVEGIGSGVVYIDDIRLYAKEVQKVTPTAPDISGLAAHYTFDEGAGTTVADSSGNGNNGTVVGDPLWVVGTINGAMQFSGDDYVNCGNGDSLQIQDAITVTCWVKIASFTVNWETILAKGDNSYRISRSSETGDSIHFGCNGPTGDNLNASAIITTDTWRHVAVVFDGAYKRIYIDGREDARAASTGQIDISTDDLYIGENSGATGRQLAGLVDDVRIYNRALSAAEIAGMAGRTNPVHTPF